MCLWGEQTSFYIARLQEVIDEDVEDIVKRVLAPSPMPEEVTKIRFAGVAVGTHERRGDRHLIERLIPDFSKGVGRSHTRGYARIDEIEENNPPIRSGESPANGIIAAPPTS